LLSPPPEAVSFAVWSDSVPDAEVLQAHLQRLGQTAVAADMETAGCAVCLVVVTRGRQLTPAQLATWIGLANLAGMDVVARPADAAYEPVDVLPTSTTLWWSGELRDLEQLAKALVDLVRVADLHFAEVPTIYPVNEPMPGIAPAETSRDLVERLVAVRVPRVIPIARDLYPEPARQRLAVDRQDYDLMRLVAWGTGRHTHAFVNARIGMPGTVASPLNAPRTLHEATFDPRSNRLILLLGEPGSGKTLQLRYFDAYAALQSIRKRDRELTANSFYVALADQPSEPNISIRWLAQRWRATVDV
jgi:hypothetical protein